MRKVTLEQIFVHPITQKYLKRSGIAHAIAVAEYAYIFSKRFNVNPIYGENKNPVHRKQDFNLTLSFFI